MTHGDAPLEEGKASRKPSALAKGLTVLEALLTHSRLSDIARATDLSPATVHRVLQDLAEGGWVYRDEDRLYWPAARLHGLAGMLREDGHMATLARPYLERLRDQSGYTVVLGMRKAEEVMFVAKVDGHSAYRMSSRVGSMAPTYSTAIGKAILAGMADEEVVRLLRSRELRAYTQHTMTTLPAILAEMKVTRRRGWAFEDGENVPRLRSIAAAVHDGSGTAIGAVGVVALEFELTDKRIKALAPALVESTAFISQGLGAGRGQGSRDMPINAVVPQPKT